MSKTINIELKREVPSQQAASHLLMIEPVSFLSSIDSSDDNYFQTQPPIASAQKQAVKEFRALVDKLKSHDIHVITFTDTLLPLTPDAIFPAHSVTFHDNGKAFVYPMRPENRRQEINHAMLNRIKEKGFILREIYDMKALAESNYFLEGTGSMVLDRANKIAYACRSTRTSPVWLRKTCKRLEYKPIVFTAKHDDTWKRRAVYHTDMMMTVAETFALVCLDSIDLQIERQTVVANLERTGKQIIEITRRQLLAFAGNSVQVCNESGKRFLIMSTTAYNSLTEAQIATIESHCPIIHSDVSTIEMHGGCSVGGMIAGIFLPSTRLKAKIITKP